MQDGLVWLGGLKSDIWPTLQDCGLKHANMQITIYPPIYENADRARVLKYMSRILTLLHLRFVCAIRKLNNLHFGIQENKAVKSNSHPKWHTKPFYIHFHIFVCFAYMLTKNRTEQIQNTKIKGQSSNCCDSYWNQWGGYNQSYAKICMRNLRACLNCLAVRKKVPFAYFNGMGSSIESERM